MPWKRRYSTAYASGGGKRVRPPTAVQTRARLWRYRLLLGGSIVLMLCSGYCLASELWEYKKGADFYRDMERGYLTVPAPPEAPSPPAPSGVLRSAPPSVTPAPGERVEVSAAPAPAPAPSAVNGPAENLAPDAWPAIDFDGLRTKNTDMAAWLLCAGTKLNYPVVYSHDNAEYLNRLFDGRPGKAGTLFIDMRNRAGFVDRNTIIYGHHMRDASMFGLLAEYKDQNYYDAHPVIRIVTEEGRHELALFSGFVADMSDTAVWSVYFHSDQAFLDWVAAAMERSTFLSDVSVDADDRVVMLSTCSYEFYGARYLVLGKLVPLDGDA